MKLLAVLFVILFQCSFLFGQDGSDMNYVKLNDLNNKFIGRKLHIDFNQRSFCRCFDSRNKRVLDTISIEINGKTVQFKEHRVDDGFNNWFKDQYLESTDKIDGFKLRIKEFELLDSKEDFISVKAFFVPIDKNEKLLVEKSFSKDLSFEKKEIVELLFKANEK